MAVGDGIADERDLPGDGAGGQRARQARQRAAREGDGQQADGQAQEAGAWAAAPASGGRDGERQHGHPQGDPADVAVDRRHRTGESGHGQQHRPSIGHG
ncbi:MAG TPA: hypothetical protein VGJ43_06785 [Acidimicrobiales bacterium]